MRRPSPVPKTCPCLTAITGMGSSRHTQFASWKAFVPSNGDGRRVRTLLDGFFGTEPKPRPAQKALPLPGRMTARVEQADAVAAAIRAMTPRSTPFSFSGRLSMT